MNNLNALLAGATALAALLISLYFLRFWKNSRDRFFLFFSVSFLLEAVHRILLGLTQPINEDAPCYYLIRLAAYTLIIVAIVDKNRRRP